MARSFFLLVAVILAGLVCSAVGSRGITPCRTPPRREVSGCKNFCNNDKFGQYTCCDEDDSPKSHQGRCPNTPITPQETEALCVGFPIILCHSDSECNDNEKCCYTLDTQHRICRRSH